MPRESAGNLDAAALKRAVGVGTFVQLVTFAIAHVGNLLATYTVGFLFAGMMISATMGYLYALDVSKGYRLGAYGGAIAGGLCAALGIAISVVLGDMDARTLVVRTAISVLTGAVGGVFGQIAADWDSLR